MKEIKLNKLARYGTPITCMVLAVVALFTWWIRYPETVISVARLTGTNAPKPVIAHVPGRLQLLLKDNGDEVERDDVIGCVETTADIGEVLKFEAFIGQLYHSIERNDNEGIEELMDLSFSNLGELQADYQGFVQSYLPYRDYVLGDYVEKKKSLLNKDISIVRKSRQVLREQEQLSRQDLDLNHTTLDKNKKLLEEQLISEQEYRELTSQHINKKMAEPQMKSGYISNESQLNAINKELVEIDNMVARQKTEFRQAVYNIKSRIEEWKQRHLLMASEKGKLSFSSFLQENQVVEAGQVLAYIMPEHSRMYMETLVPQNNFGKVAAGQKVMLRFDAYPWQEFGTLMGTIGYISPIPVDSGYYLAKISLPEKLVTNYSREIPFVEGLMAQSEIVTKDMRLAESLYYDLVKTLRR
ncbi:MAG: HlyD family secretion protein [Taibaiella sp.]|nr:HlyD family secretion protein [Taibaiella sp.]